MIYIITILVPPLYFFIRKKWGGFMLNSIFYILAFPTLFIFGIGFFIYFLCLAHAMWHLRREVMEEHAEMIATKMASKIGQHNLIDSPLVPTKGTLGVSSSLPSGMHKCSNCGKELSKESRFCMNCGQPIKAIDGNIICKSCKTELSEDSTFCWECGAPI